MKKGFSIVLLSLLFLQVGGGYVYFVARLSSIRTEMREQLKTLPDHELTLLTLSESDYKKAKVDDHEVKVEGQMYDIARVERRDGKVLIFAKHDEAEDNLLSFLQEMLHRSANDKKPVPNQFIQLLTLDFVLTENDLPDNSSVNIMHSSGYTIAVYGYPAPIDSPPPKNNSSL